MCSPGEVNLLSSAGWRLQGKAGIINLIQILAFADGSASVGSTVKHCTRASDVKPIVKVCSFLLEINTFI